MAGDWLKVCKETPDKPEILAIAARLSCHPDVAFARCFKLWCWFDSHTTDGVTSTVTKVTLDALLNRDGLCDALVTVGWLVENEDGTLELPNFTYHNGETAKTRAMSAKRQERHRSNRDKSNASTVTKVTQDALRIALPREEKRREENKKTLSSGDDRERIPFVEIFELYEAHCCRHPFNRPRVVIRDDKRKLLIKNVWGLSNRTKTLEFWDEYFKLATENAHWMYGDKHKGGTWPGANFDFLLKADRVKAIVEGNV